jgi:hypothetical protein
MRFQPEVRRESDHVVSGGLGGEQKTAPTSPGTHPSDAVLLASNVTGERG